MKTIFMTIYDGDTEKNMLRSGVLRELKGSLHRIVVLVRVGKDEKKLAYYKDNFEGGNIIVEPLPVGMTKFEHYMYHFSWNSLPTRSAYVKRHDLFLNHRNRLRYALEVAVGFMGRFRIWRQLIRWAYYVLPDSYGAELFERYKPHALFAPTMFSAEDCRLLRAARKRGIRTLTMAKSWDVPTTRGFTRVKADEILVFNEINKREIIGIGDYPESKVHPVGFPQFDAYMDRRLFVSRDAFCKELGLDSGKEIILFAVPGDFKNPYSHEIMRALDEEAERGTFTKPVQFIARFHPKYPSKGELLKDLKHFVMDRPGTYFSKDMERAIDAPASTTFQWTYTDKDIAHLANSLKHSAIVINTESTITLDAAAIDRPIVLVGFDGNQKLDYWHSVIRNYGREHLKEVLETGGARLSRSIDELVVNVNAYLQNPALDAENRELLRKNLLYKLDGHASERIARHILKMVN